MACSGTNCFLALGFDDFEQIIYATFADGKSYAYPSASEQDYWNHFIMTCCIGANFNRAWRRPPRKPYSPTAGLPGGLRYACKWVEGTGYFIFDDFTGQWFHCGSGE